MRSRISQLFVIFAAAGAASAAQAVTISVSPATSDAVYPGGPVSVALDYDFGSDVAVGGGLIIDISGPISLVSFTPSAFFESLDTSPDDTDFTGYGGDNKPASAEFEIHFGSFSGVSGAGTLGDLNFDLTGTGVGMIDLSASPGEYYGGFVDLGGQPLPTTFNDGEIDVSAVPLPTTAWLIATGFGVAALWRRRRA